MNSHFIPVLFPYPSYFWINLIFYTYPLCLLLDKFTFSYQSSWPAPPPSSSALPPSPPTSAWPTWGQPSKKSIGENTEIHKYPYLILFISFTLAGFLNPIILHPDITKNTQKLLQIAPKSVKYAFFCVQSGKFCTGQNLFTQAPPVVPVTNMRYGLNIVLLQNS